ncbi:MAG: hypothetical protein LBJ11_01215 [Oscillospiraceae bacterium]|jgi:hypothetical protein|nr:hypothetical protein [Oscillospiraceae bacterium]
MKRSALPLCLVALLCAALAVLPGCNGRPVNRWLTTTPRSSSPTSEGIFSSIPSPSSGSEQPSLEHTGLLYAVFEGGAVKQYPFGYEGSLTPEKIAAALTDLTGANFSIASRTDPGTGAIVVEWLPDAALLGGDYDRKNEDFQFYDAESLDWFMMNSLSRSIRETLGKPDVFYVMNGNEPLKLPAIDYTPEAGIPFNRDSDPRAHGA